MAEIDLTDGQKELVQDFVDRYGKAAVDMLMTWGEKDFQDIAIAYSDDHMATKMAIYACLEWVSDLLGKDGIDY